MELGYSEINAQSLAERLGVSTIIREPLMRWLESGEETDCSYEDITAFALMRDRGQTYPAALSSIDWLSREPERARKALTSRIDSIIWRTK